MDDRRGPVGDANPKLANSREEGTGHRLHHRAQELRRKAAEHIAARNRAQTALLLDEGTKARSEEVAAGLNRDVRTDDERAQVRDRGRKRVRRQDEEAKRVGPKPRETSG
jgi:hypothetical protein